MSEGLYMSTWGHVFMPVCAHMVMHVDSCSKNVPTVSMWGW